MRGLYGGFGMVCNFIALVHLKLSDATILFQTSGIFVLIFSALFLKERVPKGAGKWLLLIFVAVMVMVNPFSFTGFTWFALVAILGAALSAGLRIQRFALYLSEVNIVILKLWRIL